MSDDSMAPGTPDTSESEMSRAERLATLADEGRKLDDPAELASRTRRSFITGGALAAASVFGFYKVQTGPTDDGLPAVLRDGFRFNEALWDRFGPQSDAKEYPVSAAEDLRVLGTIGLDEEIDLAAWTMDVQDDGGNVIDTVTLEDVKELEEVEMVTLHKCDEGWSTIAHWTGVRFADFAARYDEVVTSADFVGMQTPDAGYYVGLERDRMMHRQSLLVYSLNGEPLTQDHGAPLRYVTPNNYGVKSLKRLGIVQFTNTRPPDFWAERGYDWWDEF